MRWLNRGRGHPLACSPIVSPPTSPSSTASSKATAPVRVLIVIARMNIGGPAHQVSLLSRCLDPRRFEVLLLTGALGRGEAAFDELTRQEVSWRVVPGLRPELNPFKDLRALVYLMRVIKAYRPDVVHTHTAKAGALGRLAAVLTRNRHPVVVHTYHGHVLKGYFSRPVSTVYRVIESLLARASDCLVGVSNATVDELVELGVAGRHAFRVIHIGLELNPLLRVDGRQDRTFRSEAGAGEYDVLAAYVGRLTPIKRVEMLLEALRLARTRVPGLRLSIIGDGYLRSSLEERVGRLSLCDVVTFHGFRHDLVAITEAFDFAVLASDNEGTPVALIEAAAGARPAVATDVGGVSEIVTPRTGILVPRGDVAAFAEALVEMATNIRRRETLGRSAREHVRDRFSAGRMLCDTERLYSDLLALRVANGGPTAG
jgi:glycosyltransferase involved in cell wall biosynthesis